MAKAIMIQGTMSNVGKSLLCAALCRIFTQDGFRTAPFKSQNMALNSYITSDGKEMGRAQAVQAEAASIEPDVCMNPILLKPTNDTGSQVIVMGEAIGNMKASEYYKQKRKFIPLIEEAYKKLSAKNDIIVIEGAGSPAEINLKENDIVNMGIARLFSSPVLLVGDIDRGGVFAQLVGTMELLEHGEKNYVKGLIINKFRGDKELLKSGIDMLEKYCKKPIMGIVPYLNCDIDDEDSLSGRFKIKRTTGYVEIVVVKLCRISNFTDFTALECVDGVNLRYADTVDEIRNPDMIILPGTKNTVGDMLQLRENGIEARIKQLASEGKIIFGICGGFQMLGNSITDMEGAETAGMYKGFGLINMNTVFDNEKKTERVTGRINEISGALRNLSDMEYSGYEIHMGKSGHDEVIMKGINNVYGTYVHGIFDKKEICEETIKTLMSIKGIDSNNIRAFDMTEYKNRQYDILADGVRENLDMKAIYNIIKNGVVC